MIVNVIILCISLISVIAIIFSHNYIVNIALLNIFCLCMALMYTLMNAPDVAITEASIGGCITTIFFLWTLMVLNKKSLFFEKHQPSKKRIIKNCLAIFLLTAVSAIITYAFMDLVVYGSPDVPIHNEIYQFYIKGTEEYFHFPNMVTAVLAGFRGYDTLGETTVIFTAGIAVSLLLSGGNTNNKKRNH